MDGHARRHRGWKWIASLGLVAGVVGCAGDGSSAPDTISVQGTAAGKPAPGPVDPKATFYFVPGLAITGENSLFIEPAASAFAGTYRYKAAECGVSSKIFATLEKSNSGDAIMHTSNPRADDKQCVGFPSSTYPRKLVFDLSRPHSGLAPVPAVVTSEVFVHVPKVQNTMTMLPVGGGWTPQNVSFGYLSGPCDGISFNGNGGSDRAEIRRIAADQWEVRAVSPNAQGFCATRSQLFDMPFQFTIVSSYPLPS